MITQTLRQMIENHLPADPVELAEGECENCGPAVIRAFGDVRQCGCCGLVQSVKTDE